MGFKILAIGCALLAAACSPANDLPSDGGSQDAPVDAPPDAGGGLVISVPLQLTPASIHAGQTLTGTVTYRNTSSTPIVVHGIVIAVRPPGGTHQGGPFDDLEPAVQGPMTVQPGASVAVSSTRAFTAGDPTGQWEAYPTYQDAANVWHDATSQFFTVASAGGFGIAVTGNKFTDLSGNVLQLQGENVAGLEILAPSMWDGFFATTPATWTSIKNAWQLNIIRLPLNEWSWRTNASSSGGKAYQTLVSTVVSNIVAAGMYVILDLHWAAPNGYNGGKADGQPGYLNADNSVAFWTSIADTFKGSPAVLFELFNEPFADDSTSWDATRLGLLQKGGGSFSFWDQTNGKGSPTNTNVTFSVVGHQQLVDAIRATGATNVILYSCPVWDSALSQSLSVKPTDSLMQLGATVHYANGSNADYTTILGANVPILMTEFYTLASRGGYSWAQANKIGYVMWGANNWGSASTLGALVTSSPWSFNAASVAWPPF